MKCRQIKLLSDEGHPVKTCCELLKVSTSRFYDSLKSSFSPRKKKKEDLRSKVIDIFSKNKGRYGSPRVQKVLEGEGKRVSENTVASIMKEEGLRAEKKKRFIPQTTVNKPSETKSERIFKTTETVVEKENSVWASDLTYLHSKSGFCYLVVVMDLFNREIKGWDLSQSMDSSHTKDALVKAAKNSSGSLRGLVFHSDQGSQYCSREVRSKLKLLSINQSMSRKGNCYDNAFVESFFHTLKNELEKTHFESLEEARKIIFEYINWYNRERLHSSLGYVSPMQYSREVNRLAA